MLNRETAREILATALSGGGDFAEIFMEKTSRTSIKLDDGKIENVISGVDEGANIRIVDGDRTFFAAGNSFGPKTLKGIAEDLSCSIQSMGRGLEIRNEPIEFQTRKLKPYSTVEIDPQTVDIGRKIELLQRADKAARDRDHRVYQVLGIYKENIQEILVANSRGVFDRDKRVYLTLAVEAITKEKGLIQTGYEVLAGTNGFEMFRERSPEDVAGEAVRSAIFQLEAQPAPAGTFVVVILGSAKGGVIIHEAVGHGVELDYAASGISVYSGRIGQKVASGLVTIIDDGTIPGLRGTAEIDDEGQPVQKVVLIENGILMRYLSNTEPVKNPNLESTGSGRRESFWEIPIPRMRNTFLAAGKSDPREILDSLKDGIIVTNFGSGGQVDPITGNFVFNISEAILVKNGEKTPIRGLTLVGNGPDLLKNIIMVGNDIYFSHGFCGKQNQSVPVSEGSPTIKISQLVVSGVVIEKREEK